MKKTKPFLILLSFIGIILVPGCLRRDKASKKQKNSTLSLQHKSTTTMDNTLEMPAITVWVHGTRLVAGFVLRELAELFYAPPGLTHFSKLEEKCQMYKIAKLLEERDSNRFQANRFYTYGWSGKLSFEVREEAACDLYNELAVLTEQYEKQYGAAPRIRIITHSHGGNVALNLAKIKKTPMAFTVSELVLLACPIQEETKQYIADPIFERVYSLFSRGDVIQVLDPQGLYKQAKKYKKCPLFSKRVFPSHPKLSEAKIKMYGRSILHAEFILTHVVSRLPSILDAMDEQQKQYMALQQEYPILLVNIKKDRLYKKEAARESFKTS